MEKNEFRLYERFPVYYYLISVGFLVILPLFFILYNDYGLKIKTINIIILSFGICISLVLFSVNIFKNKGYILTKEGITSFSPVHEKIFLWDEIVSYTVNGYEKKNDLYLRFYTENSLKNKGKLLPKYTISISTKLCNISINELFEKINKIRE